MYENVGRKIKSLAKAVFVVEAIIAVITGIILMSIDNNLSLFGFLILVIGPLASWLSSLLLYGFGELIDKVIEIERNISGRERFETQPKTETERINEIKELRSQGLITEDEYQQILNRGQ